jgi:hypothetical protein
VGSRRRRVVVTGPAHRYLHGHHESVLRSHRRRSAENSAAYLLPRLRPDAGRHLAVWARSAGFSALELSSSVWCFSTAEERQWWGRLWAERLTRSRFADQAVGERLATEADLERLAGGWRAWGLARRRGASSFRTARCSARPDSRFHGDGEARPAEQTGAG